MKKVDKMNDCVMSEKPKQKVRIRTHFAKITVTTSGKPYYEILYFNPEDKAYHIGFGSYKLSFVRNWLKDQFDVSDCFIDDCFIDDLDDLDDLVGLEC